MSRERWYTGITRYQWLVLIIASLGWVFDVFEGQIFVASMREAMPSLVPEGTGTGTIAKYNNIALAAFLLGGAIGGIAFGALSDRIGRKKTLTLTIVMYSLFTCLSAFSQTWWHMAIFRFLVAIGVGGEWAVASALVAEVFPRKARAWSLGIFHASSVFGTYLAVAAGTFIVGNPLLQNEQFPSLPWRLGFFVGVLPALLIIWIRRSLREPESWNRARQQADVDQSKNLGSIPDLFSHKFLLRTVVGVGLAAVGLTTFWGAHIYGKDILLRDVQHDQLSRIDQPADVDLLTDDEKKELLKPYETSLKRWEMLGMLLVTTGGGFGLLVFGPLSERIGRRGAFLFFHVGGLVAALALFQWAEGITLLLIALPVFGFLTLGMHAGYAVYFPELFPTRLRATGGGFCFNAGRILVVPLLYINGMLREDVSRGGWGLSLEDSASVLSLLFVVGIVLLLFAPETRGKDLPE